MNSLQIKLDQMELHRPRAWGNCWLGCELWRDGNTSDRTTLRGFLQKVEGLHGKARRVWLMDRGIPTEEVLEEMRAAGDVFYLVGTPRGKIQQYEKKWLALPWQRVRDSVEVKLFAEDGELYVLAKSEGRRAKERAIRRRKLARLLRKLRALRRSCPARDQLLLRIGAAKKEAGRAYGFVRISLPKDGAAVTRRSFHFAVDQGKLRKAELRDGHYLLRSNLAGEDPAVLWDLGVRLKYAQQLSVGLSIAAEHPLARLTQHLLDPGNHLIQLLLGLVQD